jgi:hypothetical protein
VKLPQESWLPAEFGDDAVKATVQDEPVAAAPRPSAATDVPVEIGLPAGTPAAATDTGDLVLPTGTQLRVVGARDGRIVAIVDNDAPPAPRDPQT